MTPGMGTTCPVTMCRFAKGLHYIVFSCSVRTSLLESVNGSSINGRPSITVLQTDHQRSASPELSNTRRHIDKVFRKSMWTSQSILTMFSSVTLHILIVGSVPVRAYSQLTLTLRCVTIISMCHGVHTRCFCSSSTDPRSSQHAHHPHFQQRDLPHALSRAYRVSLYCGISQHRAHCPL